MTAAAPTKIASTSGAGRRRPHGRRRPAARHRRRAPTTPRSPSSWPTAGRWPRPPGTTSPTCSPRGSPRASCGWSATTSAGTAARPGAEADDAELASTSSGRPRRRDRPAGADRPRRARRALDGRHDDHVPGRGPARSCSATASAAWPSCRRPPATWPRPAQTRAERLQLKLAPGMLTVAIGGARALERLRQLLPPAHPRHQKMVREPALRCRRHRRDGRSPGPRSCTPRRCGRSPPSCRRSASTTSARSSRRSPGARRDPGRRQRQAHAEAAQPPAGRGAARRDAARRGAHRAHAPPGARRSWSPTRSSGC